MAQYDYDLFVIGAGSGGVRAARMAATLGKRVAIAEDRYLGGTCVNVGCVPKKLFVYGAHYSEDFHDANAYGWQLEGSPRFNWTMLRDNKNKEIERLNKIYAGLLENAGAKLINGYASLRDAHSVTVNGQHFTAETILVATGGWPFVPDFHGSEHVITSNEAFYLERFPEKVLVVGGGYIAIEFAGIFNGLGADTELIYRRDLFLRGFDKDVREFVRDEVSKKGVKLAFNADIESIEKLADGRLKAQLNNGETRIVDTILYATGRKPKIEGLGLDRVGVATGKDGAILIDNHFQTSVPSIYALGDVVGRIQLTPVALAEGMALVKHLYQGDDSLLDYNAIPTAVFCQPNIGTVGLSEEEALEQGFNVAIFSSTFRALKHTLSGSDERCLMKMVVDKYTDKVLGVHMVGADAGEIMQGIAVAIKAGATKAIFDQTIGIHPTSAEEFVTMREPVR